MACITISRQMGSLGFEIALIVANRLNFEVVGRDLINQAAIRAGAPEAALAAIDELGLLGICPSPKACLAYRNAVTEIMHELAKRGNVVIVGRSGQVILSGFPDVLNVRVIAPKDLRTERVAARKGVPLESARAQIEASDRYRANYLRRFYHVRWDNPELYHLIINTGLLDVDKAASLIIYAFQNLIQHAHHSPNNQEDVLEYQSLKT